MHEAKTHLSRIIEQVKSGEEIIIDRPGTPVAKVIPSVRKVNRTAIGSLAGKLDLSGDWDSAQTNTQIAADSGIASASLLLDTHIVLWAIAGDPRLGKQLPERLRHEPDVFLSPVSLWEITIKQQASKLAGPADLAEQVSRMGFGNCRSPSSPPMPMFSATR